MQLRKMLFFSSVLASTVLLAPFMATATLRPPSAGLTGEEIERRQDTMQSGYVGESRTMTLTLINAHGVQSVRKLNFSGFEGQARRDKTLLTFNFPADMKGTVLLTHEQGDKDDDQWLYLPAVKRVKRIASSNKSGSFMGSEFAYEDLIVRQLDKYKFRYLGDEIIDGKDCYVVEFVPKSATSGYSKAVRWRQKSNLQEVRTDFYDRKGELLKRRTVEGYRQIDGFWRAGKITVVNVQTSKKSTITFDDVKMKVKMPEQNFSVQQFGSGQ
jgi:Outer membrane lipoprotein-sorting protein